MLNFSMLYNTINLLVTFRSLQWEISEAIAKQAKTLEHVIFANFTHPYAIDLVKELLTIVPKGIEHFNFADNGSSAIEISPLKADS